MGIILVSKQFRKIIVRDVEYRYKIGVRSTIVRCDDKKFAVYPNWKAMNDPWITCPDAWDKAVHKGYAYIKPSGIAKCIQETLDNVE